MLRAALLAAALWTTQAAAEGASLLVEGPPLSFGAVSPQEGESVVREAARVHVISTGKRWTLKVRALRPLAARSDRSRTLPISRLRFGLGHAVQRTPMALVEQVVLADQPPTPASGRQVTLDYSLRAQWGDRALPEGDSYGTELVFSLDTGADDEPYVVPSPFSPNADGRHDVTHLHYTLANGVVAHARVLDASGKPVRMLLSAHPLAAGSQELAWDGRSDGGETAPAGNYRFVVEDEHGALLASASTRLEREPARGSASVLGIVRERGGALQPGVTLTLRTLGGLEHGTTVSDSAGAYSFEGVGAGQYVLEARKPLYLPYESPAFEVVDGTEHHQDLLLVHNHSLIVGLTASRTRVTPGDLVALEAQVRAVGTTSVEGVTLQLHLPAGLQFIPASLTVDDEPHTAELSSLPLGALAQGQSRRIRLLVAVAAGHGSHQPTAEAMGTAGGESVHVGPASVRLDTQVGELAGHGGVFGRLCFDLDGDGQCSVKEPAARSAVVFLEDGSHAQADARGRYHLAPLRPGRHVLLAGPGPLALGSRPGALPKLPRRGAARALVRVPAGQYVARDLALPLPPGFDPEAAEEEAAAAAQSPLHSDDEGDVTPAMIVARARAPIVVEADEGVIGEGGGLIAFTQPAPPAPTSGQLPPLPGDADAVAPFDEAQGEQAPIALESPSAEPHAERGTAVLGLGELQLHLHAGATEGSRRFTPTGRLALTVQHEFAPLAVGSLVLDTARDGREQALSLLDHRQGYQEFGDDARVVMSTEEKLYLRLDLPSLYVQAGRMGTGLNSGELLHLERSHVGTELGAGAPGAQVRAFAGFSSDAQVTETLPGQDATGPYVLSESPVLPGSEQVELELRSAEGELRQRIRLQRGADYFIDLQRGVIDLSRPLPSRSPSGDLSFLVVRYQVVSDGPLLAGFLAGGRAELARGRQRVGLNGLYQARPGDPLAALTLDMSLGLGPARLRAELGFLPLADAELLDRSAGRMRLGAQVAPGLELFAFGLSNGAAWEPTIRSTSLSVPTLSPFGLLDAAGTSPLALPVLSLLQAEAGTDPFLLSEQRGRRELGTGTRAELGPVTGLALLRRSWEATPDSPARDHDELAVQGRIGARSRVYAAHSTSANEGELFGAAEGPRSRQTLFGTQLGLGALLTELDFRHAQHQSGTTSATQEQGVHLNARYDRLALLQPVVGLSHTWLELATGPQTQRRIAAGVESTPMAGLRAFAFVSNEWTTSTLGTQRKPGAFAGLQLQSGGAASLTARYDLRSEGEELRHSFSWSGRYRLVPDLTLHSDGQAALGSPSRLLRLGASWVPRGRFQLLSRLEEEVSTVGVPVSISRTRLAATDASLRLTSRVQLDTKALLRQTSQEGGESIAGLSGLAANIRLPSEWDVVFGARHLRDAAGGAWGTTLEAGYTVAKLLRIGAGVNLAQREEVFTIERQSPGVFLNLTAAYGGVLGGGAPTRTPEPETRTAPSVARPAPAPDTASASAPARTLRGRLYADRNGNGALDPDEPVFPGIRIEAGGVEATTDKEGRYVLAAVPGSAASVTVDPTHLPFGYAPDAQPVPAGAGTDVTVNLLAGRGRFPMGKGPFSVSLPEGKVKVTALERVRFPLAAWVAGLPLSAQEANQLERLAERVHADKNLRLVIVSHAQTRGSMRGATKRAISGAQALRRYLQAAQMVPPRKLAFTVIEPIPGFEDPLGHIELVLAQVEP